MRLQLARRAFWANSKLEMLSLVDFFTLERSWLYPRSRVLPNILIIDYVHAARPVIVAPNMV